jgi:hypothetical protein
MSTCPQGVSTIFSPWVRTIVFCFSVYFIFFLNWKIKNKLVVVIVFVVAVYLLNSFMSAFSLMCGH